MVDSLVAPGLLANILERPNTVLTASQTPSTLYPIAQVADGRPSQMFIYPAVAADDYLQADINQVINGDFDDFTSGAPDDFTVVLSGTGATAEETSSALVFGGSGSGLAMTNGASGTVDVYIDIEVLSGEPFKILARGATDDAAQPATIDIQNLQTGQYLTSGGAWQASQTNCISLTNTATLSQATVTAIVEAFSITRSHAVTLRYRMHMDGAAANKQHNWDDVLYVPGAKLGSVHGHNLDAKITAELHSDDEPTFTGPTDHGDFTVSVPTFYMVLPALVYDRYWRYVWTGTQSTTTGATALGLLFLGNATALLRTPKHAGRSIAEVLPQEEAETRLSGEQWRTKYAKFRRRFASLKFNHTQTMQTQFRDEVLKRTNDGVDPILIVVQDDRPELCLHARRPAGRTNFVVVGGEVDETELILHESGWGALTD